jgi:hypothetical protein
MGHALDRGPILEKFLNSSFVAESLRVEVVVKGFATDCALDRAAKRIPNEGYNISAEVIMRGWISEDQINSRHDRSTSGFVRAVCGRSMEAHTSAFAMASNARALTPRGGAGRH